MGGRCARWDCGRTSDGRARAVILGTAGHIDHGKTTLVRALTGVDTDRLPEEKRRGITIDLGFAPLALGDGTVVGVVDVPGHEAFVRTMVAGAAGVDVALLVIAADEGVMPQTREHLAILGLLGVRAGVVALTKRDLVEEDWLGLVEDDVRALCDGSALADAEVVAVSSSTGAGLVELRAAIDRAFATVGTRGDADLFRLPVDRAFTVKGTGTVVTGTVWSGSLAKDATVRLMPAGDIVRVRGLHAHGRVVDAVHAGERAAIALASVDLERAARGCVLVQGAGWSASRVLRADVALLDDAPRELGPRSRVRLHLGTSEVSARLVVDGGVFRPGMHVPARVVLDSPIVARTGDRFVIRSASPSATLGGGVVTDPAAPPRARPHVTRERDARALLVALLAEASAHGVLADELPVRLGVAPADVPAIVREVQPWQVGNRLLAVEQRERLEALAVTVTSEYHRGHPLDAGAPLQWVRNQLRAPDEVAAAAIVHAGGTNRILVDAGIVRLPGFAPTLSEAQSALGERFLSLLESAGREPPTLDEAAASLHLEARDLADVARVLSRAGRAVAVTPDRYYATPVVQGLVDALRAGMSAGADLGPSELRELLGFSRKYLIPFVEFCDREGYTMRDTAGRRRLGPAAAPRP